MKFSLANRNTACGHFLYQSENGTDFGTVILDILSYYFWLPQLQNRAQMRLYALVQKTCTHIFVRNFKGGCNFKLTLNDSIALSMSKPRDLRNEILGSKVQILCLISHTQVHRLSIQALIRDTGRWTCTLAVFLKTFLVFIFKVILRFKKKSYFFTLFGGFVDRT